MSDTPQLDGKVAIVTGGSSGIGFAIASALLDRGAKVVIGARDALRLREACDRLASGDRLEAVPADVRDPDQVQTLVDRTVQRFGGLDILINNAGVGGFGEVAEQTLEEWRAIIDTNLTGVFYCCHAAIPHLRHRGGGWIVNISSLAGKNSFTGGAAYCASKAGLNAFSEVLMQEVRYDDIRVCYVMPGSVTTAFNAGRASAGADWKLASEDVAQTVIDVMSLDRRALASRIEMRPSKPKK